MRSPETSGAPGLRAAHGVVASGTGSQRVDGFGFTPSALIVWWSRPAPENRSGNAGGLAFVAASDQGAAVSWVSDDNVAPARTASWLDETAAIVQFSESRSHEPTLDATIELCDDGFELTWKRPGHGWLIHYLALGGVRAGVGTAISPTGSLAQHCSGIGFRPDAILVAPTAAVDPRVLGPGLLLGLGVASADAQVCCGFLSPDGVQPGAVAGAQRTDSVLVVPTLTTPECRARVSSFDDDGFSLAWNQIPTAPQRFMFLALGGVRCFVGTDFAPRAIGRQHARGIGFRPDSLLCFGWGLAAASESKRIGRFFVGAATSPTNASATSWGDRNIDARVTATSVHDSMHDVAVVADTRTSDVHSAARLHSLDAHGFTLDWHRHDGRRRQLLYLALSGQRNDRFAATVRRRIAGLRQRAHG